MIRPISEGDAWVTNDDGDIIGIQLHGRSETVDLSNPVNGKVDPVTGGITKYANGVMIETTVTVTEYATLVSAGTVVAGCIYNVIPDA